MNVEKITIDQLRDFCASHNTGQRLSDFLPLSFNPVTGDNYDRFTLTKAMDGRTKNVNCLVQYYRYLKPIVDRVEALKQLNKEDFQHAYNGDIITIKLVE